jgi:hypothetical protein
LHQQSRWTPEVLAAHYVSKGGKILTPCEWFIVIDIVDP